MNLEDRYQFQPWHVKAYRWMRHMPFSITAGVFAFCIGFVIGPKGPLREFHKTRWSFASACYTCCIAMGHHRMGNWRTTDELIEEIRKRDMELL